MTDRLKSADLGTVSNEMIGLWREHGYTRDGDELVLPPIYRRDVTPVPDVEPQYIPMKRRGGGERSAVSTITVFGRDVMERATHVLVEGELLTLTAKRRRAETTRIRRGRPFGTEVLVTPVIVTRVMVKPEDRPHMSI